MITCSGLMAALIFVIGAGMVAHYMLFFDTSVEFLGARVNNIGLVAQKQNGIICGLGIALVGLVWEFVLTRKR